MGARGKSNQSKYFYNTRWRGWFPHLWFPFGWKAGGGGEWTLLPPLQDLTAGTKLKLPDYFCHPYSEWKWISDAGHNILRGTVESKWITAEYCWLDAHMTVKEVQHSACSSDHCASWCLDIPVEEWVSAIVVMSFFKSEGILSETKYHTQPPQNIVLTIPQSGTGR